MYALDAFWMRVEIGADNNLCCTMENFDLLFLRATTLGKAGSNTVFCTATKSALINQRATFRVPFSWKQTDRRAWLHYWITTCEIPIRIDTQTGYLHLNDLAQYISEGEELNFAFRLKDWSRVLSMDNPMTVTRQNAIYVRFDYFLRNILHNNTFRCRSKDLWKEESIHRVESSTITLPVRRFRSRLLYAEWTFFRSLHWQSRYQLPIRKLFDCGTSLAFFPDF